MSEETPEQDAVEQARGRELMCGQCGMTRWQCLTKFDGSCCTGCQHPEPEMGPLRHDYSKATNTRTVVVGFTHDGERCVLAWTPPHADPKTRLAYWPLRRPVPCPGRLGLFTPVLEILDDVRRWLR